MTVPCFLLTFFREAALQIQKKLLQARDASSNFDHLVFGIGQARRGWISRDDVANTRPIKDLLALFGSIRLK